MPSRSAAGLGTPSFLVETTCPNRRHLVGDEPVQSPLQGKNPFSGAAIPCDNEQRFRNLVELLPQTVFETNLEGGLTFVNRRALEMFGYSQEDFEAGKTCFEMIAPDQRDRARQRFHRILQGRPVEGVEYLAQRKDGTLFPAVFYSTAILHGPSPVGLRGVIVDITERKQSEEQLKAERQRAQQYLDVAGVILVASDVDGNVLLLNRKGYELLEYRDGELTGRNWIEACLPERERDRVRAAVRPLLSGDMEAGADLENWVVTRTGKERLVAWHNTVFFDDAGTVLFLLSSGEDITERKQAEEALRESEAKYRSLVETIRDIVWAVDLDGRVTYINQAAEQTYGRPASDVLGLPFFEFIAPEDRETARATFKAAVASGQVGQDVECQVIHADGSRRILAARSSALRDRQGRIIGFIGTSQDITERRQTEEALRRSKAMQAEAEKLAATGRMAARIAHEINNPLAGIKNAFRLIRDAVPADHPDHDMVERIDREIDRISNIVRQMYAMYSPQADRLVDVVVGDAVRDVLSMLEPLRRQYEVRFDATQVHAGLRVLVPTGGLHQILFNLAMNAIEASPPGSTVTIAAEEDEVCANLVRISVRDQGHGIPADIRPRIFESFFTSRPDDHSKAGLGLGLSVVKSIVEAADGTIEFETGLAQGTSFRVLLPRFSNAWEE